MDLARRHHDISRVEDHLTCFDPHRWFRMPFVFKRIRHHRIDQVRACAYLLLGAQDLVLHVVTVKEFPQGGESTGNDIGHGKIPGHDGLDGIVQVRDLPHGIPA